MVDHALLLADLKKQVRVLEEDLRERSEDPEALNEHTGIPFCDELRREYQRAFDAGRTAATYGAWRDERVTQAAVAWVLATVFVRFCEDNRLLEQPFISGPRDASGRYDIAQELRDAWVAEDRSRTDRDWLIHAFEAMSVSPIVRGLFDRAHNPMWTITPSHQAAKNLIAFWREVGDDGHIRHDFTDPDWNTRFLGDLYQDLSEDIRKNYALLQTPEFVEEFILDYTLEPAIDEFGLDGQGGRVYQANSQGFRLIDPTCGSGHFLIGAFHRILARWREADPGASDWDLIARTLRSIHGVDKNPYAVAIARFRLLIAAMKEAGITTLSQGNPDWPIVVATGDSLIHGRGAPQRKETLFDDEQVHHYATEDVYNYQAEYDLLGVNSYHAVVGNPPYITVSDRQENQNYRDRYETCSGTYALSVPFAERFFNLAKRAGGDGAGAGFVGQITANSFMKREFGKKLINEFFRNQVRLTHIIDTSGAYIPGHGTPTVILFGRNMPNSHTAIIRTVLGIQGEPSQPSNPAKGLVWSAIINQIEQPGSESEWISVADLPWDHFKKHPWNLSGGGAREVTRTIESDSRSMSDFIEPPVGRAIRAGVDEAYMRPIRSTLRTIADRSSLKPLVTGDIVRDWTSFPEEAIWYPYSPDLNISNFESELWPFRTLLSERRTFQGNMADAGLQWWEYMQHTASAYRTPLSIAFAFVATHNHFVLDRGGKVFNRSAPVIKLPEGATEDQHLELLGVLNSSTACFWLKQVSHKKGGATNSGGGSSDQPWSFSYEFAGTKLQEFPLPDSLPLERARELDALAQQLSLLEPSAVVEAGTPSRAGLNEARAEYFRIRSRMIALQEELDWDVYHRYGLISDAEHAELVMPDTAAVPGIAFGERAFEIVLARKLAAGEVKTKWFARHGATPVTEIPAHWPEAYKRVVARRIEFIESRKDLALLERPEYKRRWHAEPWEKKEKAALKAWLLDKCETRQIWFAPTESGEEAPRVRTVVELANRLRDVCPEAVAVADLYDPDADFTDVIAQIVEAEHVPYLAAWRYKESGLRKRQQWEEVWHLQRQEDALNAERAESEPERRLDIPVPPRYTSADFRQASYWANRGKLDVPKERFISYPGAETDQDGSLVLGWAGWDHAQQAQALTDLAFNRLDEHGWVDDRDKMTPLLAGLVELRPWVRQWHTTPDEYGQSPADYLDEDLAELKDRTGITDSDMQAWRPKTTRRGGRKKAS